MAFADWSDDDYEFFHDAAFDEIFNNLDFRGLSEEEIADAEDAFEEGWLNFNIPEDQRYDARIMFAEIMGYAIDFRTGAPLDFDWETFRELYDEAGG